jgi:cephalosporin hydroxylase
MAQGEGASGAGAVPFSLAAGRLRRAARLLVRRVLLPQALITRAFHRLYYYSAFRGGTWHQTRWLGVQLWKCPLDLWVYQEILFDRRPDVVIETGTAAGGSALFLASLFDLLGQGRVISIDIAEQPARPEHPRITYLNRSSTDPETLEQIRGEIGPEERVMVVLDSDHRKEHVLEELRAYSELVTPGQYLIVEDTNLHGSPVLPEHAPGPMEAVGAFLAENSAFQSDRTQEKFLLTFNPRGYLLRAS